MKLTTMLTIVVISAPNGCKLDAIDRAEAKFIAVDGKEVCEGIAEVIDLKANVRAYCIESIEATQ